MVKPARLGSRRHDDRAPSGRSPGAGGRAGRRRSGSTPRARRGIRGPPARVRGRGARQRPRTTWRPSGRARSFPGHEFYDYDGQVPDGRVADVRRSAGPACRGPRADARARRATSTCAIGGEGFARVDFLFAGGDAVPRNEINTIPGFTPISLFPHASARPAARSFAGSCAAGSCALALERERATPAAGDAGHARRTRRDAPASGRPPPRRRSAGDPRASAGLPPPGRRRGRPGGHRPRRAGSQHRGVRRFQLASVDVAGHGVTDEVRDAASVWRRAQPEPLPRSRRPAPPVAARRCRGVVSAASRSSFPTPCASQIVERRPILVWSVAGPPVARRRRRALFAAAPAGPRRNRRCPVFVDNRASRPRSPSGQTSTPSISLSRRGSGRCSRTGGQQPQRTPSRRSTTRTDSRCARRVAVDGGLRPLHAHAPPAGHDPAPGAVLRSLLPARRARRCRRSCPPGRRPAAAPSTRARSVRRS